MINIFGGSTVQPSQVSYRELLLTENVQLVWPAQSTTSSDVMARTLGASALGPGLTVGLPDARAAGVGYDFLVTNNGAYSFSVADNAGGVVATVLPGVAVYIQLIDNGTAAGAWSLVQFGSLTSAPDAASLVGPGIGASGASLYAAAPFAGFSVSAAVTLSDRAKVFVWSGGVGTQTLPLSSDVGSDFFYELRNSGTGALTVATVGGETIDSASAITLQPSESVIIHSSGVGAWYTVGRGRSAQFNFSLLVKSISTGTYTLTPTEAANVVQRYTGTLTGNVSIVLPSVVQVYYVSNLATGAFSVTFKTAGVGTTITIPSNQSAVLFCDGLNVVNSATTVSGLTALTLAQGSVGAPSINYSGDLTTGIYQPASSKVAVSIGGVKVAEFSATGLAITGSVSATSGIVVGNAATATALQTPRAINGVNFDGTAPITVPVNAAANATNAAFSVPFLSGPSGNVSVYTDTGLLYNPSTNVLATSISGNSATATKLATTRAINGVNFDGTAPITVPVNASVVGTNASFSIPFLSGASGNVSVYTDPGITYNPSTNVLAASISGSAASVSGSTSNGYGTRTVSTLSPSAGSDGDVWYQY